MSTLLAGANRSGCERNVLDSVSGTGLLKESALADCEQEDFSAHNQGIEIVACSYK